MCGATPHSCMAGCLIMRRDTFALPTTSLEPYERQISHRDVLLVGRD